MKTFASLTVQTMGQIHDDINRATDPKGGLAVTLRTIFTAFGLDWDHSSKTNRVDPTQYAIPEDQWAQICLWLSERANYLRPNAFLASVDVEMDWINYGPSHFKADEEIKL